MITGFQSNVLSESNTIPFAEPEQPQCKAASEKWQNNSYSCYPEWQFCLCGFQSLVVLVWQVDIKEKYAG